MMNIPRCQYLHVSITLVIPDELWTEDGVIWQLTPLTAVGALHPERQVLLDQKQFDVRLSFCIRRPSALPSSVGLIAIFGAVDINRQITHRPCVTVLWPL